MNQLNRELPRVLYIMGTARSGSTILEILLAGGKGVFGAGELTSLIEDGFVENKHCSCGKPCRQCEVWGGVLDELCLSQTELYSWKNVQKSLDWHDGFLRQIFGLVKSADKAHYNSLNCRLLKTLYNKTGCQVILDSSKYAGRALALRKIIGKKLKVICLTRSPIGLMASFQKPNKEEQHPKSALSALLYYAVMLPSLRTAIGLLGKDQVYLLRYERLLDDPVEVLQEIEQWSGVCLTESMRRLEVSESFSVGHLVTGNRLRKAGEVFFKQGCVVGEPPRLGARTSVFIMDAWKRLWRF